MRIIPEAKIFLNAEYDVAGSSPGCNALSFA